MKVVASSMLAPNVLTLVSTAIRAVPGVVRLVETGEPLPPHVLHGAGVVIASGDDGLTIDCWIQAAMNMSLLAIGLAIQTTVAAVLHDHAGLNVRDVNVYILDVECSRG